MLDGRMDEPKLRISEMAVTLESRETGWSPSLYSLCDFDK
jgi:hypothetical protein